MRAHQPDFPIHVSRVPIHAVDLVIAWGATSIDSRAHIDLARTGRPWGHPNHAEQTLPMNEQAMLARVYLAIATGRPLPLSVAPLVLAGTNAVQEK